MLLLLIPSLCVSSENSMGSFFTSASPRVTMAPARPTCRALAFLRLLNTYQHILLPLYHCTHYHCTTVPITTVPLYLLPLYSYTYYCTAVPLYLLPLYRCTYYHCTIVPTITIQLYLLLYCCTIVPTTTVPLYRYTITLTIWVLLHCTCTWP